MLELGLTLESLSEKAGVEARTLRSWISEGLLAPPFKPGRGAQYPLSNLDRALAVRTLKDLYGLSLSEIGRRFMMASDEQIRAWALEVGPATSSKGTAREYLRRLGQKAEHDGEASVSEGFLEGKAPSASPKTTTNRSQRRMLPGTGQTDLASIERLTLQLEEILEAPAPRRSRGVVWTRISVTPDLEISVRGELEPGERVLFEQLADQFRAILTGRTKND